MSSKCPSGRRRVVSIDLRGRGRGTERNDRCDGVGVLRAPVTYVVNRIRAYLLCVVFLLGLDHNEGCRETRTDSCSLQRRQSSWWPLRNSSSKGSRRGGAGVAHLVCVRLPTRDCALPLAVLTVSPIFGLRGLYKCWKPAAFNGVRSTFKRPWRSGREPVNLSFTACYHETTQLRGSGFAPPGVYLFEFLLFLFCLAALVL